MKTEDFFAAADEYRSALQKLNKSADFYDYELEFAKITKEFNRKVLELSVSDVTENPKKK